MEADVRNRLPDASPPTLDLPLALIVAADLVEVPGVVDNDQILPLSARDRVHPCLHNVLEGARQGAVKGGRIVRCLPLLVHAKRNTIVELYKK